MAPPPTTCFQTETIQVTQQNSSQWRHIRDWNWGLLPGPGSALCFSCFLPNHLSVPHPGMVLGTLFIGGSLVAGQQLTGGDLMSFLVASQTVQR